MFSYFESRGCSREEALKTEVVFIAAYLKKRLDATSGAAVQSDAQQEPNAYTSGMRWEGNKATKTISFGDIAKMSAGEAANFNMNVVKNPQVVIRD